MLMMTTMVSLRVVREVTGVRERCPGGLVSSELHLHADVRCVRERTPLSIASEAAWSLRHEEFIGEARF